MNSPFGFGKRARTEKLLSDIRARLDEMENRFSRVEESLNRPEARQQPQIQIENVHIHQPVLEKLEFRLDALDIEQLSGSLNLGNNFGTKWANGREPESRAGAGKGAGGASGSAAGKNASGDGGAAGKKASGASGGAQGRDAAGASGKGRNASSESWSEAVGSGGIGDGAGTNGDGGSDAGDGLRRTRSGYRWNNRR